MAEFTQEQKAALHAAGRTIVSASAGSGKTTVMIEKIVQMILNGVDVSEILAVTFTKKAAQQMKEKLKKALVKEINKGVEGEPLQRLKEQLSSVQNAAFSTIHSFCANLIRTHFYAAGTSGDFSVISADDTVGNELQQRALNVLFEEGYASGDLDFSALLSVYFRRKKDDALKKTIQKAYEALRDIDDYQSFLARGTLYDEARFDEVCAQLLEAFHKKSAYYRGLAEKEKAYFERVNAGDNLKKSIENATVLIGAFRDVENTKDLFSLKDVPKETYKLKQSAKGLPAEVVAHTDVLNGYKDAFSKMYKKIEALSTRAQALEEYLAAGENAKRLVKYVLAFEKEYDREKREKNVLDYGDLEHIALSLLGNEEIKNEVREKYKYVFVDEYQDVNAVQERLISYVGGENVFLVGDVKQAIYGFRGSRSEYFVEKKESFAQDREANALSMNSNFRSAPIILRAVNEIFSEIMNRETSFVDYKKEGKMNAGGDRYAEDGRVRFHLVQAKKEQKYPASDVYSVVEASRADDEKYQALIARGATGDKIAQIVEEEVNTYHYDPDEGVRKKTQYKDVAILLRKSDQAEKQGIVEALTLADIPFSSSAPLPLDSYPEIKAVTDVLSYVDNAEQDVPLCSALLSFAGRFTAEELAKVRIAYREEQTFRGACSRYAQEKTDTLSDKLRAFFAYFSRLRDLAAVTGAAEVLTQLFSDTGAEAFLLARRTGKESLKRLNYFLSLSVEPEPLSVHAFLEKLRLMKGKIDYYESAGENVVHIMTMHASKGLEFPVVILGNCCEGFRGRGGRGEFSVNEALGVATKYYDTERFIKKETLLRDLIDEKKMAAERADELNIFYVALTRAKFALHLVFEEEPQYSDPLYASKYAEFISREVFERYLFPAKGEQETGEETTDVRGVQETKDERAAEDKKSEAENAAKEREFGKKYRADFDESLVQSIVAELQRPYAHSGGENLSVKQSATSLIGEMERSLSVDGFGAGKTFADDDFEEASFTFDGESEKRRLTGLAYHAFLQFADFLYLCAGRKTSATLVENERRRLRQEEKLSEEYDGLLQTEALVQILNDPVFLEFSEGLKEGETVLREANFLAALPVREVYGFDNTRYGNVGDETTLFQGAIDLLKYSKDSARIVDYKFSGKSKEELLEKYTPQLALYRKAVAKITGVDEGRIRCTLFNLKRGYSVDL